MDIVKDLERHGYRIRGILCPEVRIHGRRWGFKVVVYPGHQMAKIENNVSLVFTPERLSFSHSHFPSRSPSSYVVG